MNLDLSLWIFSVDHCCSWRSSLINTDEPSGQTFIAFPGAERSAAGSCSVLVPPEPEEVLTLSFPLTKIREQAEVSTSPHAGASPITSLLLIFSCHLSLLPPWRVGASSWSFWRPGLSLQKLPPALLLLISEALQTSRRLLQQNCRASILLFSGCLTSSCSSAQLCFGLIGVYDCDLH